MAELRTCENGHYFDPDIYPNGCPYCTGASVGVNGNFTAPLGVNNNNVAYAQYPAGGIATTPVEQPGETVPPREEYGNDIAFKESGNVTVAVNMKQDSGKDGEEVVDDSKFVVGWLVAVEGPYIGKSFEIHNGYTHIGRREGDIVLSQDEKVSSVKNVSTIYDSLNNRFFVSAGASTNLVYINNEPLITGGSRELTAYSSIKIGRTKLLFVPFCSEHFSWVEGK